MSIICLTLWLIVQMSINSEEGEGKTLPKSSSEDEWKGYVVIGR